MKERNRQVFETFPDTPYAGEVRFRRMLALKDFIIRAAAVLAFPLAVYTIYDLSHEEKDMVPVYEPITAAALTYNVNNGVKGDIVLPDGTKVKLNSGSELKIADDFPEKRRAILNGEGYFEVKADKEHPFYITTPQDITIRVTGTVFNLCCYTDQKDIRLNLEEGSVDIVRDDRTIYTMDRPEDIRVLDGQIRHTEGKVEETTAWTEGRLVFDNTPMDEVIARIERWYGVRIYVKNPSIYEQTFTGDFNSESVGRIFDLMKITNGIRCTIDKNEIIIL